MLFNTKQVLKKAKKKTSKIQTCVKRILFIVPSKSKSIICFSLWAHQGSGSHYNFGFLSLLP